MKIYVFGNPLVEEDRVALDLMAELQPLFPEIEFIAADPNENFPPPGEHDLIIMDTAINIEDPQLITLEDLLTENKTPLSPHDYDLSWQLILLKKLGRLDSVVILALPSKNPADSFLHQAARLLRAALGRPKTVIAR